MPDAVPAATSRRRTAFLVVAALVALTNVAAVVVVLGWPALDADGRYSYAVVESARGYFRAWMVFAAANLVVGVTSLALAGWLLVPARGWRVATGGATLMWLGSGLYAVGIGIVAGAYYFGTEPGALDAAASTRLLDHLHENAVALWAPAIAGAALVGVGQIVLGVALWRARTVPRWVPVLLWTIPLTFVFETSGPKGLIVEAPQLIGGLGVAWFLWQAATRPAQS
jgi:hypothetical protein